MNNEQIKALIYFVNENTNEYSLSNTYSGRFMYGTQCLSLTTRDRYGLSSLEEELESIGIPMGCVDHMGMGLVIYWPGTQIQLKEEDMIYAWENYCSNYERETGYEVY